jgi:hypothetical protein
MNSNGVAVILSRPVSLEIDEEPFHEGYTAGWQSVRGRDDQPMLIRGLQCSSGRRCTW